MRKLSGLLVAIAMLAVLPAGTISANAADETPQEYLQLTLTRTDSNGTFVLAIVAKSTPLRTRYTATRVDVQELAKDDTVTAVTGLSSGDFVITTSPKPIEAGTQLRLVENN